MSSATTSFTMYTSNYTGSCLQWVQLQRASQCTHQVTLDPAYNEFSYKELHNVHFKLHWVLLTTSSATRNFTMYTSSYTGSCLQRVQLLQTSQCTLQVTLGPAYNEFSYYQLHNVHFKLHWVLLTMSSATTSFTMYTSSYTGSCLQRVQLLQTSQCTLQVTLGPAYNEFSYYKLHNVHFKLQWVLLTMSLATTSFTTTIQVTLGPAYNEFSYYKLHNVHFKLHWVLLTMSSATKSFTMYTSSYTGSYLQWVQLQRASQCTLQVTMGPAYNEFGYNELHNVHIKLHWILLTMSSATKSFTMHTSSYTGSYLQWVQLQRASQCTLQVTLGPAYNEFGYNELHNVHFNVQWILLTKSSATTSFTTTLQVTLGSTYNEFGYNEPHNVHFKSHRVLLTVSSAITSNRL